MKAKKRLLSLFLCCAMLFSLCPQVVSAEGVQDNGKTIDGLCEHHPAHNESCGYTEGIPGTPCNHEHTDECYTEVTSCVHEHRLDCYPAEGVSDNTATPSDADAAEPTECAHECSEESGCITKKLDCRHEHNSECGYTPATEGTPCGFVCEACNAGGGGTNPADPAEKPETECICKTLCTEEERNADCLVCGAEGADLTLCKGAEPETATPSNAAQLSTGDVQKLIDELPTADELAAMTPEEQQAVYTELQAAYDAYEALTDEQKAEVTGAEIFDSLFAFFNGSLNTLETVNGVKYLDENGVDQTADNVTVVDSSTTTWNSGWYVVNDNIEIDTRITVNGEVYLILANDVTLNAKPGISVTKNNSFTIYAQSINEKRMGALNAGSTDNYGDAGIGGDYDDANHDAGSITVNGGRITANGCTGAAIGGGGNSRGQESGGNGGVITINGGIVSAYTDASGAAIGGGDGWFGGDAGTITINGGTVRAGKNWGGTAIGGGFSPNASGGDGGTISISGGAYVTASGIGSGGSGADLGNLSLSGDSILVLTGTSLPAYNNTVSWDGLVISKDNSGSIYGGDEFTLTQDIEIPEGVTLNIESGKTLNVSNGVTLTNNGSITGSGTLDGSGDLKGSGTIADTITNKLRKDSAVNVEIDPSEAVYGSTVTITAEISKKENALTRAAAQNKVDFYLGTVDNGTFLKSVDVSDNTATLQVSLTDEKWTIGQHTITAEYGGSMGLESESGTATLTVKPIELAAPANLNWDSTTPGKAVWDAVENANGYSVRLYKDGEAEGTSVSVSDTEYNFNITEAGTYSFKVQAIGTGNYSNSVDAESGDLTFYTVSFNTNGGGSINSQVVVQGGKAAKPPAPTKTGYTFGGWYSDSGLNTPYDFDSDTISDDTTLYAKWTAIIYKVTVTVEGGTDNTASASPASATIETQVTLTATPAEGYHFVEWKVVSGGITISKQNTFTMPAGNVEVKAVFAEHQFSNWKANGNDTHMGTCSCGETKTEACRYIDGTCSVCGYVDVAITTHPESATVKEGQPAAFAVAAKGDDISYQWQIKAGNNDWADISEATASSYTTNVATMEMNGYQYRCTVSNGKGDSATSSAATLTVKKGASHIDPAYIGYFVEHYQKDPVSGRYELADREYRVDKINQTVTATPKEYTGYTCNPDAAGTVTSGTLKEIKGEKDIVVLKLYYDPDTYDVTLNGNGGQIADGKNVTSYTYGVGATLPAAEDVTRSGYAFKGWYEDSSFSGDPVTEISTTATGDKTYYAKWAKLWTVTVKTESGGSVSGSGTFEENTEITVTATPNGGYHFVRWTENGAEVSTNANYTFTLTADRTLTAVFSRNSSGGGGGGGSSTTYYTLTFDTNGGSKIDTFRTSSYGKTVDLSGYTPTREGYDFNGWYSDVGLTNRITEIRLNGDKTVYAGWTKQNPGTGIDNPFTDVKESDWFYNDVMFVYQNGLMSGTSSTTFEPNANTSRAQLAVIFYRLDGSPVVEGRNSFTDVEYGPGTAWYYDAVTWAQQKGVVAGYEDGSFHPDDPITREQLAMIFYNYAKYKGYNLSATSDLSGFADAGEISPWVLDAMKWAVGSGLMNGKGNNILDPKVTATRAEVAAMLHKFIENNRLVPPAAVSGGNGGASGWTQGSSNPQTGDNSNIGLWFSLMLASLSALIILVVIQRRKPEDEETLPQLV